MASASHLLSVCMSDTMATPIMHFQCLSFSLVWHKYRRIVWHKAPFSAVTGTYRAQHVRSLSVILHLSSVFCTAFITLHHNTTITCLKRTKQTWLCITCTWCLDNIWEFRSDQVKLFLQVIVSIYYTWMNLITVCLLYFFYKRWWYP